MTDPTNHPQGAEEYLKNTVNESPKPITRIMEGFTEDWLKYFAERVVLHEFNNGRSINLDSLLSEVTAKMKEGK